MFLRVTSPARRFDTSGKDQPMFTIVTTKHFERELTRIPMNWQKRIVAKIRQVAADPYSPNRNVTKLQGRDGYRLRVGDWRIIYELDAGRLLMLVVEMGARGGIY